MLLAGDGVGPEVVNETTRIIKWFEDNLNLSFDLDEGLVGGASYDKFGVPLTDETLADAMSADAILFGSVGGPQYDKVSFDKRPPVPIFNHRSKLEYKRPVWMKTLVYIWSTYYHFHLLTDHHLFSTMRVKSNTKDQFG